MLSVREVLTSLLVSLTLATLGSAAYTPDATATKTISSASTTTSTGIATHTVQVGPKTDPHSYVPHNITANPGDVIVFEFYPTNHSVVKADYLAPCVPASEGVFYSGSFNTFNEQDGQLVGPVPVVKPPTWSLIVNDTEPTFFYCTAIGSCLQNGMVGVINPNTTETWQAQYNRALTYPYMLVPGQSMPAEGSTGSSTSPTTTSTSTTSATTTAAASGGGHSLSSGAIAGIAVACIAFVAILVALFFVLGRNRVYRQWISSEDGRTERTARWAMFNSPGGSTRNGKSELDSNANKAPPTDVTSVGSPDGTHSTFSPPVGGSASSAYGPSSPRQASGHWTWEAPQNVRSYQFPTELEANSVGQPQVAEMSDVREYQ